MTPRRGWPSQVATTVKSHSFNAIPPSSTLAAQIIDNFADADRQQAPNSQAVLRQLLREILDTDQGVKSSKHSVESNTEINHRLIYVIYRAGVETLDNNDPFNRESDLRTQALDSLAVIDLTIRQSPDVLFYIPQPNGTRNQPDGPLFLWLIPHLTNLLIYPKSTEIQAGAESILKNALSVQNISTASKTRLQPIRKYIQGCIKGIDVSDLKSTPRTLADPCVRSSLVPGSTSRWYEYRKWYRQVQSTHAGDHLRGLPFGRTGR